MLKTDHKLLKTICFKNIKRQGWTFSEMRLDKEG